MSCCKRICDAVLSFHRDAKNIYFLYIIVVLSTGGLWLPILLKYHEKKEVQLDSLPLDLITFSFIFVINVSVDKGMRKLNHKSFEIYDLLVSIIIPILSFFFLLFFVIFKDLSYAYLGSILAFCFSMYFWWISNKSNNNFNGNASLGGIVKK